MLGRLAVASCLALVTLAAPAGARGTGEVSWESRAWKLEATGLPASVLADRPDWAERQVMVDGKLVWVVAVLPASARQWGDRMLLGTRQAHGTLIAFAEYLVQARHAQDPVDYQERQLTSVRHRLKAGIDLEGFVKVETVERPRAVWMRLGYPADRLEAALGFQLPGSMALDYPPRTPPKVGSEGERVVTAWDYVWESAWLAGVVIGTVAAVLFAQATQP